MTVKQIITYTVVQLFLLWLFVLATGYWHTTLDTYICKLKIFSFIPTVPVLQFIDILAVHSFLYSINHWDGSSYCLPGKLCKILIKICNIFGD